MKQLELNNRKVAVIGCGFVGATSAFGLMQSGLFSEMVLIDANTEKAEGEAMDISHGIPFARPMKIYAGGYDDIMDAAIIVVTAGANQKPRRGWIWYRKTSAFLRASSRRSQREIIRESCLSYQTRSTFLHTPHTS